MNNLCESLRFILILLFHALSPLFFLSLHFVCHSRSRAEIQLIAAQQARAGRLEELCRVLQNQRSALREELRRLSEAPASTSTGLGEGDGTGRVDSEQLSNAGASAEEVGKNTERAESS